MNPPAAAPTGSNLEEWRSFAQSYLAEYFPPEARPSLGDAALFEASPLEGEGATALFAFAVSRQDEVEDYYVAVGRTEANYYPSFGLSPAEAFDLHLGTRFTLVLGVAQKQLAASDSFDAQKEARRVVDRIAPQAKMEDLRVAACFDVDGQTHAVLRCRLAGTEVYIFAGDAPPGFSERIDLPPHVAYRIQLGHALRLEPKPKEK
jgi:hypothetical protein